MAGNVLVIGGTSGLGYELAKLFAETSPVIVTGRAAPLVLDSRLEFRRLELDSGSEDTHSILNFVQRLPRIDTLVIAAGYAQFGGVNRLQNMDIMKMFTVGLIAPVLFIRELLHHQRQLPNYMQITSTSQWTPRPNEPVYAAAKAGIGMFAESIAGDPNVGRVMVAGPSGMKTAFWNGLNTDTSQFLEPSEVAAAMYNDWSTISNYEFRQIAILRNPLRVEVRKQT